MLLSYFRFGSFSLWIGHLSFWSTFQLLSRICFFYFIFLSLLIVVLPCIYGGWHNSIYTCKVEQIIVFFRSVSQTMPTPTKDIYIYIYMFIKTHRDVYIHPYYELTYLRTYIRKYGHTYCKTYWSIKLATMWR